jgi:membrane-bound inhibitor of C-type lysozyme
MLDDFRLIQPPDDGNMRLCKNIGKAKLVKDKFAHPNLLAVPCLVLLLSGCGGNKLWPFGGEGEARQSRVPANATEYQCDGGKRFFVLYLDNGATAWLIYPDREVGLAKAPGGTSYSNGVAVLEINGSEAKLTDGTITYNGGKVPMPAAK